MSAAFLEHHMAWHVHVHVRVSSETTCGQMSTKVPIKDTCITVLEKRRSSLVDLKVHKIEIFFGFDFEICIISLLVM